jgi:hypothetical protein
MTPARRARGFSPSPSSGPTSDVTLEQAQAAGEFMENVLWQSYFGSPMFWPEPGCDSTVKRKTSVHIIERGPQWRWLRAGGLARVGVRRPHAQVLGGNVSGNARIEDHAIIWPGATVSGGTVGAFSILNRFTVSGQARVETTFCPPGYFEPNQGSSGTARPFGDVEYRGGRQS